MTDEASVRQSFAEAKGHSRREAHFAEHAIGARLAIWQSGPQGLKWIAEAAGRERGIALVRDGYPNWYLVRANDLLPGIRRRHPYKPPMYEYPNWHISEGDVILPGYLGKTTIAEDEMNRCDPDDWLLVVAWDES